MGNTPIAVKTRIVSLLPAAAAVLWIIGVRNPVVSPPWWEPLLAAGAIAAVVGPRWRSTSPPAQASVALLVTATAARWVSPDAFAPLLGSNPVASLYGALFLRACLGFAPGHNPFTTHFARKVAPEAVWETDLFRQINREMSFAWTALFAVATGLAFVSVRFSPGFLRVALADVLPAILLLGVGIPLNRLYPDWRQRRSGVEPTPPAPPSPKETTMSRKTIVAVNGSPHEGIGNTARMIECLRAHLEPLGVDLEEVFLARHEIGYCVGCGHCLEKGGCWIKDDHPALTRRLLDADGVILASPVYIDHVTAQMKTFLDRCLPLGHKPRMGWKPGLAIAVSAGLGETTVGEYLGGVLRVFGAYPVGTLTAIAVSPGEFVGSDAVDAHAADLARDLVAALDGGRRRPATDRDLRFWQFMGCLVRENRDFMKADFAHWEKSGLFQNFEHYVGQTRSRTDLEPAVREAWLEEIRRDTHSSGNAKSNIDEDTPSALPATCAELLKAMPSAFDPDEGQDLEAVYQFEIEDEGVTGHMEITHGTCTYHNGPAEAPGVVIRTPGAVWLAIARGDLDGQQAFMTGQYRVEGDLALLMRLPKLFGSSVNGAPPVHP